MKAWYIHKTTLLVCFLALESIGNSPFKKVFSFPFLAFNFMCLQNLAIYRRAEQAIGFKSFRSLIVSTQPRRTTRSSVIFSAPQSALLLSPDAQPFVYAQTLKRITTTNSREKATKDFTSASPAWNLSPSTLDCFSSSLVPLNMTLLCFAFNLSDCSGCSWLEDSSITRHSILPRNSSVLIIFIFNLNRTKIK